MLPGHTQPPPVTVYAIGDGLTIMIFVTMQPEQPVKLMTAVPAVTPITIPVEDPTDATDVLLLLQWPHESASVSVTESPTQTTEGPVITAGAG